MERIRAFLEDQIGHPGQVVQANGFSFSPSKVSAVLTIPEPTDVSELRAFLDIVQHYSKFMPGLVDVSAPLNESPCKSTPWCWREKCIDAVDGLPPRVDSRRRSDSF